MIVDISQIIKVNDESLSFSCYEDVSASENYPDVCRFLSPVKVEGTITNLNGIFQVVAKGNVFAEMICGRCLKPVKVEIPVEIFENFSITGNEKEETETFSGDSIDLTSVAARGILTGLPMKVICDNDCKGLCPICGKDLNEGDCSCDTSVIDPRFESLRSLFKLDEEV